MIIPAGTLKYRVNGLRSGTGEPIVWPCAVPYAFVVWATSSGAPYRGTPKTHVQISRVRASASVAGQARTAWSEIEVVSRIRRLAMSVRYARPER